MHKHLTPDEEADLIFELLELGETEEVEFKSAKGGFPRDFWESYSAFANTQGGIIVLGVKEDKKQQTFSLNGLDEATAKKLKEDFWRQVNNRQVVSHCVVQNADVQVVQVGEAFTLKCTIPPAPRELRPIYIGRVADEGTYRRNDTGDFKCIPQEVRRMMADADLSRPADGRILKGYTWEDIDLPSFEQFRRLFDLAKPAHAWLAEDNDALMSKLGGYRKDRETGEEGFTLAGLLMFGKRDAIGDAAPHFFLDYREMLDPSSRWSDRKCSTDGTWEANLFQFYRLVLPKLRTALPTPFQLKDGLRRDETLAHEALREAFANLCVHADYSEECALLIERSPEQIVFSNPGVMLITKEQFLHGGVSVCRNPAIQQMFMMMGAAEKAGSGVDKILRGWGSMHWNKPYLQETFRPNMVALVMPLSFLLDEPTMRELQRRFGAYIDHIDEQELRILAAVLTEKTTNHQRLSELFDMHRTDLSEKLKKLCHDGILTGEGHGRGKVYHLNDAPAIMQAKGASSEERMQAKGASLDTIMQAKGASSDTIMQANNDSSSTIMTANSDSSNTIMTANSDSSSTIMQPPSSYHATSTTIMQPRTRRLSKEQREALVCQYCQEWHTVIDIALYLGRDKNHVRNSILPPLVEAGKLEKRYPAKNHPRQEYRATNMNEK